MYKQVEWLITIKQIDIYFQIKLFQLICCSYNRKDICFHTIAAHQKIISCSDSIGKSNFFFYSFQIGKDQTQNTDTQIDVST